MITYDALVQCFGPGFQGGGVFNSRRPYALGSEVPQDGEHGASVLANDTGYAAADAVRAFLIAPPAAGTMRLFPDGSGYWEPQGAGEATARYEAYVNGQSIGVAEIALFSGGALEEFVTIVAEHDLRWMPLSEHTITWNARPRTGA